MKTPNPKIKVTMIIPEGENASITFIPEGEFSPKGETLHLKKALTVSFRVTKTQLQSEYVFNKLLDWFVRKAVEREASIEYGYPNKHGEETPMKFKYFYVWNRFYYPVQVEEKGK